MALDVTPGEIAVKTRDQFRDDYLRDYSLRVPTADVGPGTQPFVDASTFADGAMILANDAIVIGRGTNTRTSGGVWLKTIGESEGVFERPAVGSSGAVAIVTSTGGGTILYGTELLEKNSGLRFKTISPSALYVDGDEVEVAGVDTGPGTNFRAGTILLFQAPPPGVSINTVVVLQNDGSGLSGGRDADSDELYRLLIEARRANPPASGNDAEYARVIESTPGISVEKAFTFPAILSPGTTCFCFTKRPAKAGNSRIPNPTEIATVYDYLIGHMPADDSIFACTLTAQPVTAALRVTWAPGALAWYDVDPWPSYLVGDMVVVDAAVTPTPTTFRLTTATSTTTPLVGQTIGFYDASVQLFQRKRIGTVSVVSAGLSWDITADTSNAASDTSYTPFVGQVVSPYSGSLDALVPAIISYFDGLGPGEQVATFPDPGRRQRRQPSSPTTWPSTINSKLIAPILAVTAIENATVLLPANPFSTTVGTPGVQSFLITLGDLCAFV